MIILVLNMSNVVIANNFFPLNTFHDMRLLSLAPRTSAPSTSHLFGLAVTFGTVLTARVHNGSLFKAREDRVFLEKEV